MGIREVRQALARRKSAGNRRAVESAGGADGYEADVTCAAGAVDEGMARLASTRQLLQELAQVNASLAGPDPFLLRLLAEPAVTDVLVNPAGVWVERGGKLEPAGQLPRAMDVRALAVRMAAAAGVRLDDAAPIADGTLPDGTRLHAVLSPPAQGGPVISLRTKRPRSFTMRELIANNTVDPLTAQTIEQLVKARACVILTGATGSGKTTLLSAILSLVPADQRIICIEDVPELAPHHPHVVSLTSRNANVQGQGAISLTELVRAALRMRPDRIVLGECRGAEIREVMAALNTGHEGGWVTLHANDPADVPARLAALGALAGLTEDAVYRQAVAAFDAVIHVERTPEGRKVAQVSVFEPHLPLQAIPALTMGRKDEAWQQLKRIWT